MVFFTSCYLVLNKNKISDRIHGRIHPLKPYGEYTRGNKLRSNLFLNRMATSWNNLTKEITLAPSIKSFKSKLDSYLGKTRIKTRIWLMTKSRDIKSLHSIQNTTITKFLCG